MTGASRVSKCYHWISGIAGWRMGVVSLTDEKIAALIAMPKRVTNPAARRKVSSKHEQVNYNVIGSDDEPTFQIFARQSIKIAESFSCGLLWI